MTRTGRCLCGAITHEIEGETMAVAVCHCDHFQRQCGGAFSTNVIVWCDDKQPWVDLGDVHAVAQKQPV